MAATGTVEERLALLEEEVRRLQAQVARATGAVSGTTAPDFLDRFAGIFGDDPTFGEAVRLGREWRDQGQYPQIIQGVLQPYTERRYSGADIINEAIFDCGGDHYLITSVGWQGYRRAAYNLLHLDIVAGKIWIQKDGTEDGIAEELEAAGVPKHDIVLAFKHRDDRALIPEYAVA